MKNKSGKSYRSVDKYFIGFGSGYRCKNHLIKS